MMTVNEVLNDIRSSRKQVSASQKDEVRVMKAMLNDQSYEVGVYAKEGKVSTYSPAKDFRSMQAGIISQVAKISKLESEELVSGYEATTSDASTMVNISKEFTNTYLLTGRKLPLGGREKSNWQLVAKEVEEKEKTYQRKISNPDGTVSWEQGQKVVPAHISIKAKGSCPTWVE